METESSTFVQKTFIIRPCLDILTCDPTNFLTLIVGLTLVDGELISRPRKHGSLYTAPSNSYIVYPTVSIKCYGGVFYL